MSTLFSISPLFFLSFFLPSSICLFIVLFLFYFVLVSDSGLFEFSKPGRVAVSVSERWKGSQAVTSKGSFFFSFLAKAGALPLLHICKGQGCWGSAYQSFPPAWTEDCTRFIKRNRLYQYRFLEHKKSLCYNITVKVSRVLNK